LTQGLGIPVGDDRVIPVVYHENGPAQIFQVEVRIS
jgi:hypothetical protein